MSFDSLKESETIFKQTDRIDNTTSDEAIHSSSFNEKQIDLNENSTDLTKHVSENKSKKYPKFVFLIILNEFCERFSYYGIRTVMFIFLTSINFFFKDFILSK